MTAWWVSPEVSPEVSGSSRPDASSGGTGRRPLPDRVRRRDPGPARRTPPPAPDHVQKMAEKQTFQNDLKQHGPSPRGRRLLAITVFIESSEVNTPSGAPSEV